MIIFLTVTGTEFQTPGNRVEYKPPERLGEEALFQVKHPDWSTLAQVRACEVVGWYVVEEEGDEAE